MKSQSSLKPNDLQTPFNKALKYLSFRSRSIKETHDYLAKKQYTKEEISETIKKLIELKFLNDDDFARNLIENMQRKGKSKKAICFELKMKGIEKNVIEKTLKYATDDINTAVTYISKILHQFDKYEPEERQKKIISRLRLRGFNWDIISEVLKRLEL